MAKKIPVSALYRTTRKMLDDKWGYIWGTAGKFWTAQLQANPPDDMARKYGSRWVGHMVSDCSGVMVYIWKQYGLAIAHGSNSIARKHCGRLVTFPQAGYAAFKWREDDPEKYPDGRGDFYHIGIVGEDGQTVYEAQGTVAGFTTSPASRWDFFAPFNDVDYAAVNAPESEENMMYRAEVTTKSGSLNVRSGPGTSYARIAAIPKGEVVDVLTETDGWAYISDDGVSGYVSAAYLTETSSVSSADSFPAPQSPTVTAPHEMGSAAGAGATDNNMTILRHIDNGVTFALVGAWEIIGGV